MSARRRSLAAFVALWLAVACLDISSPVAGIAAITPIIAPTPSVVTGDMSRDSLGEVAALRVYAFGPNGDTIHDVIVRFVSTDTMGNLEVDSITGIATGHSLSPTASVIARVMPAEGGGVIQTTRLVLPVVPVPRSVERADNPATFEFPATTPQADSLSANLISSALSAKLRAGGDTTVPSYLVSFEIVHAPTSRQAGQPSVLLVDDNGRPSRVDTTDASGTASRRVRVRIPALPEGVLTGAVDTVVVRVRVRYKQDNLPVTPSDSFILAIRGRI